MGNRLGTCLQRQSGRPAVPARQVPLRAPIFSRAAVRRYQANPAGPAVPAHGSDPVAVLAAPSFDRAVVPAVLAVFLVNPRRPRPLPAAVVPAQLSAKAVALPVLPRAAQAASVVAAAS